MMLKASKLIEGIKEFALGDRSGQTQPKSINPKILAIHSMLDAAKRQPKNNALENKVAKIDDALESLRNEIRANEKSSETKEKMLLEKAAKTGAQKNESAALENKVQGKIDALVKSTEKTIEIIDNLSSRIDAVEAENAKKTKPAPEDGTRGKIDTLARSSEETIKTMKSLSSRIAAVEANERHMEKMPEPISQDMENRLAKMDDELEYLKNELRANEKDSEIKEKELIEKIAKTGNTKAESGSFDKVQGRLDALARSGEETIKTMKALSSRIDSMEAGKSNAESPRPIDSDIENRLAKMDDELEYLKNELRANESKPEITLPKEIEGLEEKVHARIDSLVSSGDKTLKIIEGISSRIDTLESEKAVRPNNNSDMEKRYGALAKELSEIKKEMSGIEKNIESIRQANKDRDTVGPLEKSKRWIGLKTGAGQDDDTAMTLKRLEEIRKSINT